MDWLFDRMKEKSTWIAIATALATLVGFKVSPENAELIAQAGVAVATAALVLIREKS